MNLFIYDQSFEGLLSAIHDALETGIVPDKILSTRLYQDDLFATKFNIITDQEKSEKLWDMVRTKSSKQNCERIYIAFLSELPEIELIIYNYIKLMVNTPYNTEADFSNEYVVKLNAIHRKVSREAQRILMFVRFQKTVDDIFYASHDPQYNVLPLAVNHFKSRFADQKWVIFDTRRRFGYYYDLKDVREITISNKKISFETGKISADIMHVSEKLFQNLWQNYYNAINIKERKNLKVHMQFLPKRFWKYLPEKDLIKNRQAENNLITVE